MMIPTSYIRAPDVCIEDLSSYKFHAACECPEWVKEAGVVIVIIECDNGIYAIVKN